MATFRFQAPTPVSRCAISAKVSAPTPPTAALCAAAQRDELAVEFPRPTPQLPAARLECPDDAMDHPRSTAPTRRRVDQLTGQTDGLTQHPNRLHEVMAGWLITVQELCRENQELRRMNHILGG